MGINLLKNEERLGLEEVEYGGGGERGPLLLEGGLDSFDDILGRGSELFHQSS